MSTNLNVSKLKIYIGGSYGKCNTEQKQVMITIAKQRIEEDYWKNLGCPAIAEVIHDVLNLPA